MSAYGVAQAGTPTRRWARDRVGVGAVGRRRGLQLALGLLWLADAALQYQPSMFRPGFVTGTLEPAAAGTPYVVEHPALWADHLMVHHIAAYNAVYATLQLLIALAIFYRPTVRVGLALSVGWGLAVWWLAEGTGGITDNASPVMGAPGAVLLYVLIAVLVWPRREGAGEPGPSVAEAGPLGRWAPRVAWVALWTLLGLLTLERDNRAPSALHDMVQGMAGGEPGWVAAMDRGLAAPLAHHGTEVSLVLAALFGVIAVGGVIGSLRRPAVIVAAVLGLAIWVAEDFGGVFTGFATDVNSGLLLVLLAATFWPLSRPAAPG